MQGQGRTPAPAMRRYHEGIEASTIPTALPIWHGPEIDSALLCKIGVAPLGFTRCNFNGADFY